MPGKRDWSSIPRGWISPKGTFFRTREHWKTICRKVGPKDADPTEAGDASSHRAYSKGWISIGHGGALNVIAHKRTLESRAHPGVARLRRLLAHCPHFALRVEKQLGKLDPETGKHQDFEIREYDLDYFIKRGRLRKTT